MKGYFAVLFCYFSSFRAFRSHSIMWMSGWEVVLEPESKTEEEVTEDCCLRLNPDILVSLLSYTIQLSPPTFVSRLVNKIRTEVFSQFRFLFTNKSALCQIDKIPLGLLPCHYHHFILVKELSAFHLFLFLNIILFYL